MAAGKGKRPKRLSDVVAAPDNLERITKLLALLLVKGESQSEKIRVLSAAGFANTEVAEMLGMSPNAVNVALHRLRAGK